MHGTSPRANSEYWSQKLDRNRRRDAESAAALRAAGWQVLRIWEHVPTQEAVRAVRDVLRAVDRRRLAQNMPENRGVAQQPSVGAGRGSPAPAR